MKKPTWRVEEVCRVLRMQGARARVEERVLVLATMVIGTAWRRLSNSEDLTTIGSLWSMVVYVDTGPVSQEIFSSPGQEIERNSCVDAAGAWLPFHGHVE